MQRSEPVAGKQATEALELLIWRPRGDYTSLIVTHNMAQARRASEQTAFMPLGRMVEHGPTADLFLRPRRRETADYVEGGTAEPQSVGIPEIVRAGLSDRRSLPSRIVLHEL